jgi:diadenosine tetraphosphate (Ap4A) HIT family hydrolase
MSELTSEELLALQKMVVVVENALKKSFGAQGFNCAWNEGEVAGQNVPHFHLHVLPRTQNDGGVVDYEPRSFLYRPGSREVSPESELQAVAAQIKDCLAL